MKKLVILTLVAALGGLSALAQGTIQFQNASTFQLKIAAGTDSASLAAATAVGTNPQSEALGGGPGQVTVDMFLSLASNPSVFFLAGTTSNSASALASFQGTFHGGNPYTIPAALDGGAFGAGTTVDYYFTAATASGAVGTSATGTGYVLGGGSVLPGSTFGAGAGLIGGFTIAPVPEPSIMILSGLGAAAMLLYRRKK